MLDCFGEVVAEGVCVWMDVYVYVFYHVLIIYSILTLVLLGTFYSLLTTSISVPRG